MVCNCAKTDKLQNVIVASYNGFKFCYPTEVKRINHASILHGNLTTYFVLITLLQVNTQRVQKFRTKTKSL